MGHYVPPFQRLPCTLSTRSLVPPVKSRHVLGPVRRERLGLTLQHENEHKGRQGGNG